MHSIFEGKRLEPVSLEKNMVGFCDKCDSDLESLAYHRIESGWLVSARCKNEHLSLMRYDLEWNWLGDQELQISAGERKYIRYSQREAGGGLHARLRSGTCWPASGVSPIPGKISIVPGPSTIGSRSSLA